MAIIINNMDIPGSCALCKFEREVGKFRYCRLTLLNTELCGRIRLSSCPLKSADKMVAEDCISREAVMYYIKSHIHEIITESGTDKNAHTNAVLRDLLNGVETMPGLCSNDLVNMMAAYIQQHDIKTLMELVMQSINKAQGGKHEP